MWHVPTSDLESRDVRTHAPGIVRMMQHMQYRCNARSDLRAFHKALQLPESRASAVAVVGARLADAVDTAATGLRLTLHHCS